MATKKKIIGGTVVDNSPSFSFSPLGKKNLPTLFCFVLFPFLQSPGCLYFTYIANIKGCDCLHGLHLENPGIKIVRGQNECLNILLEFHILIPPGPLHTLTTFYVVYERSRKRMHYCTFDLSAGQVIL